MSAAWAWLTLALGITLYVVGYDLWAHFNHHYTLSRQMHDWIFNGSTAQFVVAGALGFLGWFVTHLLTYHDRLLP